MRDWMDLNGDGKIDGAEMMFAGEMLCTSREEHEALFGDAGDFEDDASIQCCGWILDSMF